MIPAKIATIRYESQVGKPLVILRSQIDGRVLSIPLGHPEAKSIFDALKGIEFPRPQTHDLIVHILDALAVDLPEVRIVDFRAGVFFAELALNTEQGPITIDARPSDALAIAVRLNAPIFVANELFEYATSQEECIPRPTDLQTPLDSEIEEFKKFIAFAEPDDFDF